MYVACGCWGGAGGLRRWIFSRTYCQGHWNGKDGGYAAVGQGCGRGGLWREMQQASESKGVPQPICDRIREGRRTSKSRTRPSVLVADRSLSPPYHLRPSLHIPLFRPLPRRRSGHSELTSILLGRTHSTTLVHLFTPPSVLNRTSPFCCCYGRLRSETI